MVWREAIVSSLLLTSLSAYGREKKPAPVPPPACTPISDDYYESLFAPPAPKPLPMGGAPEVNCHDPSQDICSQAGDLSEDASQLQGPDPQADDRNLVPEACVRAIMEQRPQPSSKFLYSKCNSDSDVSETETIQCVTAPRLSDGYVSAMRRAFIGAFRCLGEDPRDFVGLIGAESAFQINIGNTSHAWGPGQITPGAGAPEIYAKRFDPYRGKQECKSYSDAMSLRGIKKFTPCMLTAPPLGPVRNFLITGLLYKSMRTEAAALVPAALGKQERSLFIRDLTEEFYNAGDGAVTSCWHNYIADHPDGAASYESFKTGFPSYLLSHYGDGIKYFENNTASRDANRIGSSHYAAGVASIAEFANQKSKGCAR